MKTRKLWLRLVIAFLGLFAAIWITSILLTRSTVNPGDVVFSRISTNDADWVELYNRTNHVIDLSGYLLSDGKATDSLREGTLIQPKASFVIVKDEDEQNAKAQGIKASLTWHDFGFSHKKREFALLLNRGGSEVMDFVHTWPLKEGEILEREVNGSGKWWIVRGAEKRSVDLETLSKTPGVDRGALAQSTLDAVQFLKQFSEGIAGILAAFGSIAYALGLASREKKMSEKVLAAATGS